MEEHSVCGAECNIFRVVYESLQTSAECEVKRMIQGRIRASVQHWVKFKPP